MPEYPAPGVYVEEVANDPKSIEGVATSTTGFLGEAERGTPRFIPPRGAVASIYARSDSERGVWKVPANEVVRDALELQFQTDDGT